MRRILYKGKLTVGITVKLQSVWIGYYYSELNKRVCINLIPFVTIWIVSNKGKTPIETNK